MVFPTTHAGPQVLRIVDSHKYLGGLIENDMSILPDIKIKLSMANAQLKPLRKPILSNQDLALSSRKNVIQALGLSKIRFGICTWAGLNKTHTKCGSTASCEFIGTFFLSMDIIGLTTRFWLKVSCRHQHSYCNMLDSP